MPTTLLLVGGFLGAGKTTLLGRVAAELLQQGQRVGLITNDQAAQLVDTGLLRQAGVDVSEIAGGCFCCRFGELVSTTQTLIDDQQSDIIVAEPVGSCTDLSATVLQPLKDLYADRFRVAPFSVLVDPDRLREALEPRLASPLHASARYILRKQLEEADILVLNKVDKLHPDDLVDLLAMAGEALPGTPVYPIAALTGEGVSGWLRHVLQGGPVGMRITEVDYDTYAEGEAVLGWLNATALLTAARETAWDAVVADLMGRLHEAFQAHGGEVGHVKLLLTVGDGAQLVANLTSLNGIPAQRGEVPPSGVADLVINARVEMSPEALRQIVEQALAETRGVQVNVATMESLSPGRPMPTHRYAQTV